VNTASSEQVARALATVARVNPHAPVVRGALTVRLETLDLVRGRRALVVEDGPTITHGSMPYGAGFVAATAAGAAAIVDPRAIAVAELAGIFARYPHIGPVLPAVGYSPAQVQALAATIERSDADVVVAATPVDLARLLTVSKPIVRARYEFQDPGPTSLGAFVDRWLAGVEASQRGEAATPAISSPPSNPLYSRRSSRGTEVALRRGLDSAPNSTTEGAQ
jgi:predicted GTPase